MRHSNLQIPVIVSVTVLAVLLVPETGLGQSAVAGQSGEQPIKIGMTGEQLFDHQWQRIETPKQEIGAPNLLDLRSRRARLMLLGGEVVIGDGLGPLHNARSCAECHEGGGGAGVAHNVTLITVDPRSNASGAHLLDVFPGLLSPTGLLSFTTVVHDHSTRPGYAKVRDRLADYVPGGISSQWFQPEQRTSQAIAKQPVVAGRHASVDFYLSQRNSPALFGLGIIESISVERIRALAQRQAEESDGKITGRYVGKFGWQGQVSSLSAFVSQACAAELGLNLVSESSAPGIPSATASAAPTRPLSLRSSGPTPPVVIAAQAGDPADFKYANFGSDMTLDEVTKLTRFVASIPRPTEEPPAGATVGEVFKGERNFEAIGCSLCHSPDLYPISGMFSDLLLHDMGPRLQSPSPAPLGEMVTKRVMSPRSFTARGPFVTSLQQYYGGDDSTTAPRLPEPFPLAAPEQPRFPRGDAAAADADSWDALQREWRTPPLWGVADTAPYLHDGRAETLEDAILWHGGEAESSRAAFSELSRPEKDLVLVFLSSLRAPQQARDQAE